MKVVPCVHRPEDCYFSCSLLAAFKLNQTDAIDGLPSLSSPGRPGPNPRLVVSTTTVAIVRAMKFWKMSGTFQLTLLACYEGGG